MGKRFLQLANCFRTGVAIAIAISTLIGLVSCGASPVVPWESAQALPSSIVNQVVDKYAANEPEQAHSQLKVWQIEGSEDNHLAIVDFNSPHLCGAWGCLYVGLWIQGESLVEPVFQHYLDPHVPPERRLFTVLPSQQIQPRTLPCIRTLQPEFKGYFQRIDLCFDSNTNSYQVWRSSTEAL